MNKGGVCRKNRTTSARILIRRRSPRARLNAITSRIHRENALNMRQPGDSLGLAAVSPWTFGELML
jgi:hypothetical protein